MAKRDARGGRGQKIPCRRCIAHCDGLSGAEVAMLNAGDMIHVYFYYELTDLSMR